MAVTSIVCGPAGEPGVTYVVTGGHSVTCGTDSAGNVLMAQVATLSGEQPVNGGDVVGLELGAAVLSVLAAAWCVRAIRDFLNSCGEV